MRLLTSWLALWLASTLEDYNYHSDANQHQAIPTTDLKFSPTHGHQCKCNSEQQSKVKHSYAEAANGSLANTAVVLSIDVGHVTIKTQEMQIPQEQHLTATVASKVEPQIPKRVDTPLCPDRHVVSWTQVET